MKCKICSSESSQNNLRFGVCWNCAEAESIIGEGLDMDDNGLDGKSATYPMDKVKLLIKKGWHTKNPIIKAVEVTTTNQSKQLLFIYVLGIATGIVVLLILNTL